MQEHEFPLDADPNLRKYVKLEIERESVELKLREMKARFTKIAWRSLLSFVVTVAIYSLQSSNVTIVRPLVYGIVLSILVNSKTIYDVIANWRDVMNAKRELQSWDMVLIDYNDRIRKEDSSKEKES